MVKVNTLGVPVDGGPIEAPEPPVGLQWPTWNGEAWRSDEAAHAVSRRPPVPERVTARQAVEALIRIGVTEAQVEASLAAIPDATQRAIAQNLWRRSNDFERSNPTLIALATQSLGMTEEQLDQLFITASTL